LAFGDQGVGVFFAVAGLLVMVAGLVLRLRIQANGRKAAAWPTAPGIVVSSEVVTRAMGGGRVLLPVVTYRYEVAGAALESIGLRVGAPALFNSRARAQALADRYPAGSQVTVHYDPASPTIAALDLRVGEGYGPLIAYAFGGTFFVLGVFTAIARV
jgi:hypothetical protein